MLNTKKVYLTKRPNGFYYVLYYEGTRRRYRSTKCTRKSDALHFLTTFHDSKKESERTPILSDLFTRFKTMRADSIRPSTMELYRLAVDTFEDVCKDKVIDEYTLYDIERFKNAQIQRKVSKVTVNIYLRSVKAVFEYAVKHEWLQKNPFPRSIQFSIPQRMPVYITKEDFHKLLEKVREPMFHDLFVFASLTGMRLSEILHLTWDKVDFERRQITISNSEDFTTKTGRIRTVPMHDTVFTLLSARKGDGRGYVFTDSRGNPLLKDHVSKRFKRAVRDASLSEELHFHSMRHSCASWLVDAGVSLYVVQNILGHTSISTTQIYSHLSPNTLLESINRVTV